MKPPIWLGARTAAVFFLLLLGVRAGETFQEAKKEEPPSPADQAQAEKLIKEIFKADYAKRAPVDRQALARVLLDQGIQTKEDANSQFVLLREAREIGAQAGDAVTALAAVDELSKRFTVDSIAMKQAVLATVSKVAKTADQFKQLVAISLKLIESALRADDYESAEKVAASASQLARKTQDVALNNRIIARRKEIAELKLKYARIKKAMDTLVANPNDEDANLIVGQFRCFSKGDWDRGLPLLAKGADPDLRDLAEREIAALPEPTGQMAIGDAWWDLADKESASVQDNLKEHASQWYGKALGGLTGLNKAKTEKRLSEYSSSRIFRGNWLDITDPKLFDLPGKPGDPVEVVAKQGFITSTKLQFPKGEFDGFSAKVVLDSTRECTGWILYDAPSSMSAFVDSARNFFVNARAAGGSWNHDFVAPWQKDEESLITVLLTDGEWVIYLNSKEMTRVRTSQTRVTYLGLEARNATVKYERIQLRRAD